MSNDYFKGGSNNVMENDKYMHALEMEDVSHMDDQRAAQYVRERERELMGLDKPVYRSGFITFKDYETKLKMMDHPLYLFGLKLYDMPHAVEFFDADFSNTLVVMSALFEGMTLRECCGWLNSALSGSGFHGGELTVGQLKDITTEFDLNNIMVKAEFKIQLRFNDFPAAYAAYRGF